MAFCENLILGKAYIAPSTSLQVTFLMPWRNFVTMVALSFKELKSSSLYFKYCCLVDYYTPFTGGLHIISTMPWPMTFEQRLIDLSFVS